MKWVLSDFKASVLNHGSLCQKLQLIVVYRFVLHLIKILLLRFKNFYWASSRQTPYQSRSTPISSCAVNTVSESCVRREAQRGPFLLHGLQLTKRQSRDLNSDHLTLNSKFLIFSPIPCWSSEFSLTLHKRFCNLS